MLKWEASENYQCYCYIATSAELHVCMFLQKKFQNVIIWCHTYLAFASSSSPVHSPKVVHWCQEVLCRHLSCLLVFLTRADEIKTDCSEMLNGILLLVPDLECLSGGLQEIRELQIWYSTMITFLLLSHLLSQLKPRNLSMHLVMNFCPWYAFSPQK